MTIYLVSCVGKRQSAPAPARELYALKWFARARASVESTGSEWRILMARHGPTYPDTVIAPYGRTLSNRREPSRHGGPLNGTAAYRRAYFSWLLVSEWPCRDHACIAAGSACACAIRPKTNHKNVPSRIYDAGFQKVGAGITHGAGDPQGIGSCPQVEPGYAPFVY
ncbi:DUF6884 domain-containing protein [Burkholderia contaminans]|uniref:DUF6884 domain-containing protein n=1 Tax=Burkholderia contaminans TaxID=488447 RepID=UPI003BF99EAD